MNSHYKKLRQLLAALTGGDNAEIDALILSAMDANGTPISKSRLQGWGVSTEHKNYRRMSSEELLDLLDALVKHFE